MGEIDAGVDDPCGREAARRAAADAGDAPRGFLRRLDAAAGLAGRRSLQPDLDGRDDLVLLAKIDVRIGRLAVRNGLRRTCWPRSREAQRYRRASVCRRLAWTARLASAGALPRDTVFLLNTQI